MGFYRSFTAKVLAAMTRLIHPFPMDPTARFGCVAVYLPRMLFAIALSFAAVAVAADPAEARACPSVRVIDGDTLVCGAEHVRLQGIDAPEVPGHCRVGRVCAPGDPAASTANLRRLVARGMVECRGSARDTYGRTIGRCSVVLGSAGGIDLSCAQLAGGFAIRRYAAIRCW